MSIKRNFRHTKAACYTGGTVQAMVCVFMSLLVVIFGREYNIPLSKITLLLTVNYITQFATDFASVFFIDKIKRKTGIVTAHVLVSTGFAALGILPGVTESPYSGIFASVVLFSVGGGLLEVLISPILDSCPSKNKAAAMSILHAMFSLGSIGVILLSTVFFAVFGQENWMYLSFVWAAVSAFNGAFFMLVPINEEGEAEERMSVVGLFKQREFILFAIVMICGGAAEIGMSQWASAFAESSLGVPKAVGDILGPCMFAVMMAVSRLTYPKLAGKINLMKYIMYCSLLCFAAYLIAAFSPFKLLALAGCGLCGFSVGIMWPGTISLSARVCSTGGTAIFALMALAGDIGCTIGPAAVGFVSSAFGGSIRAGLLSAAVFPLILFVGIAVLIRKTGSIAEY